MLRIYNTLAREIQEFVPIRPGEARLYVCGMTVYDYCHLGHARMLVAFDMVQRWLRARGYRVTYVRNITDIDDKILRRALEQGEDVGALTARFIQLMNEDMEALGVQKPDHEPSLQGKIARWDVHQFTSLSLVAGKRVDGNYSDIPVGTLFSSGASTPEEDEVPNLYTYQKSGSWKLNEGQRFKFPATTEDAPANLVGAVGSYSITLHIYGTDLFAGDILDVVLIWVDIATERLSVNPIFSWREAVFTRSLSDRAAPVYATRSPLERSVLALIDPLLVPNESAFLRKNTFRMVFHDFDWKLNDLTGR